MNDERAGPWTSQMRDDDIRSAGPARAVALVACAVAWLLAPTSGVAQDRSEEGWAVRILDASSGVPLSGVEVTFPESGVTRVTDSLGVAEAVPADVGVQLRVVVDRLGYELVDTVLVVPVERETVDLLLERAPVGIPALTVAVGRAGSGSRELARVMFNRDVAVGAVGMTSAEVKAMPAVGEPDVFRSLRSLSGVTGVNDYQAGMYVRGGNSDQVGVRWEGAPVFGPYHMFGVFGVFNPDAVETVELYKGSIPARYGGSLSGVVSARQRTGGTSGVRVNGGLSFLGVRAAADGSLPWGGARWLAAGRRATLGFVPGGGPYSFYDLNLGLRLYTGAEHSVGFSMLASDDEFTWDIGAGDWLDSRWTNLVSSLAWTWVGGDRVSSEVTAYVSRYEGELGTGAGVPPPVARNVISALGLRAVVTRRGERTGARGGVVIEGGPVSLHGSGPGAYVEGDASGSYSQLTVFGELEQWFGPLRLAPGFRASVEGSASRRFFEPRLAARLHAGPLAVSASVDRTHQFLSVLHDDRYPVPGAPMWFVREQGRPVSLADGASVALDAWRGERWTGSVGGWTRRFRGIPFWRPQASRLVSDMAFHNGDARGWEAMVQRHAGFVRGWISYQWTRVRFTDGEGAGYLPAWDRRHEVDGVVTMPGWRGWSASLRGTVATGTPFWVPLGWYSGLRYNPNTIGNEKFGQRSRNDSLRGLGQNGNYFTILSNVQGRVPYYARMDLSVRYEFRWGSWGIAPFVSVPNITGRANPYGYGPIYYNPDNPPPPGSAEDPNANTQIPPIPFVGVDFRF